MAQTKVASEIARSLMREAAERGLVPGDHLGAESWLLERYGVARGSLREALRLLEAQGAVEMRRGAGGGAIMALPQPAQLAGVLAMTLQSGHGTLRTILEARAAIEPTMTALAAQRRTPEQVDALLRCTEDLLTDRHDSAAFHLNNRRFHDLVAAASDNLLLAAIVPALSWMSQAIGWEHDPRVRKRIAIEKQHIAEAIEQGDSWSASQRMSRMISAYEEIDTADPHRLDAPVVWADVDELLEKHLQSEADRPAS
ncbi:FadR/GntR family transcriptional regulator [Actinomadura bangladeshensis]|uniref:FadR family transcriptional regulator n=1 Tax=Actinomadura bangladeshensis TaxID=453573 RepID=A0A4R4PDK2_9ACTN|nr:FCD domain-containing protein [Actinomadura bangladeshensis]TDC20399.1 FadR family transcriptional regulator [Actinomadura bangladeshensis]